MLLTARWLKKEKNNEIEEISIPQLGTRPMERLDVQDAVAWHNIIPSHMPGSMRAESGERKAHSAPSNSDNQFVSKAPHGDSLIETDTVHVFAVRPLSTVDIMFNWKYA